MDKEHTDTRWSGGPGLAQANRDGSKMQQSALPLEGIRVVEFTHMVMGPAVGVILADLGAEVIKVEPVGGDN
ncbi:MAG: CoA transferase, partial [Chromatocurvus sp.]